MIPSASRRHHHIAAETDRTVDGLDPLLRRIRVNSLKSFPIAQFMHSLLCLSLRLILACLLATSVAQAARPFLCSDSAGNKVAVVSAEGKIEWEYACKSPRDVWALTNGNFLIAYLSGAVELTRAKQIVWEYKADETSEVHACQPLPNGRVLIVECGSSRLIEVDRAGKVAKEIKLTPPPARIKLHTQFRGARKTATGHYFVSRTGENEIEELDGDGKSLRRIPVPGDVHEVLQLPDGHLLVALGDGHKVMEFDATMKVVWELNEHDVPGQFYAVVGGGAAFDGVSVAPVAVLNALANLNCACSSSMAALTPSTPSLTA